MKIPIGGTVRNFPMWELTRCNSGTDSDASMDAKSGWKKMCKSECTLLFAIHLEGIGLSGVTNKKGVYFYV